jgi:uncharacterized protein YneF (UPF0154 family)
MNKFSLIFLSLILNQLLVYSISKSCGEEEITNCKECGVAENSNSCGICEDNHFPLLDNLLCFPCDDPIYGQAGCKGQCDSSKYSSSGFVYCKNCKDGYYNLEDLCHSCDYGSPGCSNCTNEKDPDTGIETFKCLKCLNEQEYRINDNHRCVKCSENLDHCEKCHYVGETGFQAECDKCESGYFVNSEKKCQRCDTNSITGGWCRQCSPDSLPEYCYCISQYVLFNYTCINCPSNCDSCEYNSETKSTRCLKCESGYTFNSVHECTSCGVGCRECYINEDNKPICQACDSGSFLEGNQCLICPSNCAQCSYDIEKSESICSRCNSYSILDSENNKCISCQEIEEIGGSGCLNCRYLNEQFECINCYHYRDWRYDYEVYDYAYVNNTFKCLSNTDPEKVGLYGCLTAEYIQSSKTYQCFECKNNSHEGIIPVPKSKSCIHYSSLGTDGLSNYCLEAEKIGDYYSCTKCNSEYALVEDATSHLKNCYERKDTLSYCQEGKKEDGNLICSKCVTNAALGNDNKCSCNSDSFSKNLKVCYKCDDKHEGNPGCDISVGCDYFEANDRLNCKKCKEGYFEYTKGQCFSCADTIPNCNKCHYNTTSEELECDSCLNSIYALNIKENECELNECEEYPNISPGCIICKDKLDEYKQNNKCQRCKYGYFKTNDEKCVYCSSEKNGGNACHECEYKKDTNGKETENIVCKGCYPTYSYFYKNSYSKSDSFLSNEGKCYNCKILFGENCDNCNLVKNLDGTEKLKCISCKSGYYLSNEGNCVRFVELITKIPYCRETSYSFNDIELVTYVDEYSESIKEEYFRYEIHSSGGDDDYQKFIQKITSTGMEGITKKCLKCFTGSFLNDEGKCEELTYDKCTFGSILKNYIKLKDACYNYCNGFWRRVYIKIKTENLDYDINNFEYSSYYDFFNKNEELSNLKACISNLGEGGENSPENLKLCRSAYYYPENKTFVCNVCSNENKLNFDNLCQEFEREECMIENLGTEILPVYGCRYNHTNYTLVTYENGEKEFIETKGDLEGCAEAIANTTYVNSKYNCTKCTFMYVPYYSKYFDRIICQNVKAKVKKENVISSEAFNETSEKVKAIEGVCDKDYLFTPDGEYCYKCNSNESFGMRGCKGSCSFSLTRSRALKCEGECKTGYIESSEGICSPCQSISKGCYECHYDTQYPENYTGIKRERRFVCDFCEGGYIQSASGKCLDCEDLGLAGCTKCELAPDNDEEYVCKNCIEGYFLNKTGQCEKCDEYHFQGINDNKCIQCSNALEGGIEHCRYCKSDGEKAVCHECLDGYIYLTNNNSCLEIANNKELQKFFNCDHLTLENNKLICSKCKEHFSLIKNGDNSECIFIRTLYDYNFENNYQNYYYTINDGGATYDNYSTFIKNDYIYQRYNHYSACQEAENIGTEENPLYSCKICYDKFNKYESDRIPVRITEENSNAKYCVNPKNIEVLENCIEATYKIKNGKEEYNCTDCAKNNVLTRNKVTNTYYCQSINATTKCVVLFCKTCNPYDGYICDECLPDYAKDSLTGYCVKKTEVIPAVTWKDIYRLNMNGVKEINNRNVNGPSLNLRGITSSQINSRHAFLIYLTFKIKHGLRSLQGENGDIRMPAICEIVDSVDETDNDVNMVDYECIGNQTNDQDLTNYALGNIEEGDNPDSLKKSNLNDLVNEIKKELGDLAQLEKKIESTFTYDDLLKIIVFKMDNKVKNITADEFKFKIKIDGTLNKDIVQTPPVTLVREFELSEVENTKANCKFTIELNKVANLNCDLNVENHKDIKAFSFKTSSVYTDDKSNEIYLAKLNDIVLINNEEEDDDKTVIIIIIVVCCVVGAAGIGVGIYFLVKKLKTKKVNDNNINLNENNIKAIQSNENLDDDMSGKRVSKFENK